MKKKVLSIALVSMMAMGIFAGCGPAEGGDPAETTAGGNVETEAPKEVDLNGVELSVVTTYGGDDGQRGNYETAFKDWEKKTGAIVKDASGTANEEWKVQVMNDFNVGAEPDVFFYFCGADSNQIVKANQVVSLDEIREVYPDYGSNMDDGKLAGVASPVDGKTYVLPTTGYWEAMFVNKYVLEQSGVKVPDETYTWDQFLKDCETIKSKGYTPIAVSLAEMPHYWFEFAVYNYNTPETHNTVPADATDAAGKAWVNGLNDIKSLYEKGYLPKNTLSAKDDETAQLMIQDKAAFLIDGSWKRGYFETNAEDLSKFTVTFPPSNGQGRKTTDTIGGISSGYFITRKAWESDKRDAAVSFVEHMTSTPVLSTFSIANLTACNEPLTPPDKILDANGNEVSKSLVEAVEAMNAKGTGIAPAVQDNLDADTVRKKFFEEVKNIAEGKKTAEDVVNQTAQAYKDFLAA